MKFLLTVISVLLLSVNLSSAQEIRQVLLGGPEKMVYQTSFSQDWPGRKDIRFNGMAFFNRFMNPSDRKFDEAVMQANLIKKITPNISSGPLYFTAA